MQEVRHAGRSKVQEGRVVDGDDIHDRIPFSVFGLGEFCGLGFWAFVMCDGGGRFFALSPGSFTLLLFL